MFSSDAQPGARGFPVSPLILERMWGDYSQRRKPARKESGKSASRELPARETWVPNRRRQVGNAVAGGPRRRARDVSAPIQGTREGLGDPEDRKISRRQAAPVNAGFGSGAP